MRFRGAMRGRGGKPSSSASRTKRKTTAESLLFRFRVGDRGVRALEADLRMRAVAERLDSGTAAAAERLLAHRNLVALRVSEAEIAVDEERSVFRELDRD